MTDWKSRWRSLVAFGRRDDAAPAPPEPEGPAEAGAPPG